MFPKYTMNLLFVFSLFALLITAFGLGIPSAMGQSAPKAGTSRILATGEIRVGVRRDSGPYGYEDENGECCIGFDVDIAKELAKRWHKNLILQPVRASERIPLLANGDLDLVVAAMTHTKDRDKDIDFSQSYFQDGLQLLVRRDSGIKGVDELSDLRVGAVISTTGLSWAEENAEKYKFTLALPYSLYNEAVNALIDNSIDALISDGGILSFRATQDPDNLIVVGGPYTEEFYGIGVPQGDSVLRDLVNHTLQAMKAGEKTDNEQKTYDEIYKEWFGDKVPFPIELAPGIKTQDLELYQTGLSKLEEPRIDTILQSRKVVIGVPSTKGFQADIAHEFANRWLGDAAALDLRVVTTQTGLIALVNDEADLVINDLLPTWKNDQAIDFSQTYAADQAHLLVYNNSGVQKLEDLRDKAVAVVTNTPYQQWIETEASLYNLQVKSFANYEVAFSSLTSSEVPAIIGDQEELNYWAEQNLEMSVLETSYAIPYAIALPQGEYRLRELVNFTLQTMKEDGFYDCLYKKWFPQATLYTIEILPGTESYLPLRYENLEVGRSCLSKSTIQRIRERENTVVVGVLDNFPPMGFINENNDWVGFDLDLVDAMAKVWGVKVERVKALASQRIPLLMGGEVDLVAGAMTHTRDRDALIDFSQNYFFDGQSLLVRKGSDITGPLDLSGKRVGAIEGTTGMIGITAFRDNKGLQFEIVPFTDDLVAVETLSNNSIDAFTTDRVALLQFAKEYPALTVVGEPFSNEPYGLGLPAGDSQFRHLVDATLQELYNQGIYQEIHEKWFPNSTLYTVEILPIGQQPYTLTVETFSDEQRIPILSVIEKMQNEGKLVAGVLDEVAPFGELDESDQCCVGFDVELIKEFAKRWLGNDSNLVLQLEPIKLEQRVTALANGEVDIVAAQMTHNWERERIIDFSQTYFFDRQDLLVHKNSAISTLGDLKDKRVAAVLGTTSFDQIQQFAKEIGFEVVPFQEQSLAVDALIKNQVAAYTIDSVTLERLAAIYSDLLVVGKPFSSEPYGIGIPENDHEFRDLVNSTLQEMQLDGTYDRLYQKWFGTLPLTRTIEIWPRQSYTRHLGFSQTPMVYVPAGEFLRGNEKGESDEKPEKVIFLDEFYIDQYEVTNRLYRECVDAKKCTHPQKFYSLEERGDYYNNVDEYGNYPVIWVTWEQANQYCRFLGKRLPREAEWEKAARGPQNFLFPWGNELSTAVQAYFVQHKDTVAVASSSIDVSPYQVYDMSGNVREWVNDFYDPNYYRQDINRNPIGPKKAVRKVVRGGSWITIQANLWRATSREGYNYRDQPSFANNLGFRCASDKPPVQLLPVD